jgi:hypothetical protein
MTRRICVAYRAASILYARPLARANTVFVPALDATVQGDGVRRASYGGRDLSTCGGTPLTKFHCLALGSVLLALAGCQSNEPTGIKMASSSADNVMDAAVPQVAEDACVKEVGRTTKSTQLVVLEKVYSEANSQVKVGVGPDRAPWLCMTSNDGVVASVISTAE